MATRTWSSSGSTDINNSANYSGAGALLTTDDLVFNGTSVVNAAATANLTVNSVTITSAYTGTWSFSGFTLTLSAGSFTDDGITGTHNYGNGITLNGASATMHAGAGIATLQASSCILTFNGTTGCTLDNDKGGLDACFKQLVLGAAAKVTSTGAQSHHVKDGATVLTLGNNATLTNNSGMDLRVTASVAVWSVGTGCTINGSGDFRLRIDADSTTMTIPAITISGSGSFDIGCTDSGTLSSVFVLSGNFNIGSGFLLIANQYSASAASFTFNTGNYSITCGALWMGTTTALATITLNFGSSAVSCTTFSVPALASAGTTTVNLQTASISCSAGLDIASAIPTLNPGTSTVTFTGTGTLNLNGRSLAGITLNAAGGTLTFGSAVSATSMTVTAGSVTDGGYSATFSSSVNLQSSTNLTLTGTWTITGDADLTFNASGTATLTAWSIVVQGTGRVGCYKSGVSLYSLTCGNTGKTTTVDQQGFTVTNFISISTGTLQIATYLYLKSSVSTPLLIATGGKIGITAGNQFQIQVPANCTLTLPAITTTAGTQGVLAIGTYSLAGSGNSIVNLGGDISAGIMWVLGGGGITAYNFTLNFNGYNITTTDYIRLGVQRANGVTINLGSSRMTAGTYFETTTWNTNAWNLNLQTGSLYVGTNFTLGSNTTLDGGNSCSIVCTGTGTFTTAGQTLCSVTVTAPAGTVTLGANVALVNLTVTAGSFSTSTYSITSSGSLTLGGTNITLGGAVTMTGTGGAITITASGTVTTTNAALTIQGATTLNFGAGNRAITSLTATAPADIAAAMTIGAGGLTGTDCITLSTGSLLTVKAGVKLTVQRDFLLNGGSFTMEAGASLQFAAGNYRFRWTGATGNVVTVTGTAGSKCTIDAAVGQYFWMTPNAAGSKADFYVTHCNFTRLGSGDSVLAMDFGSPIQSINFTNCKFQTCGEIDFSNGTAADAATEFKFTNCDFRASVATYQFKIGSGGARSANENSRWFKNCTFVSASTTSAIMREVGIANPWVMENCIFENFYWIINNRADISGVWRQSVYNADQEIIIGSATPVRIYDSVAWHGWDKHVWEDTANATGKITFDKCISFCESANPQYENHYVITTGNGDRELKNCITVGDNAIVLRYNTYTSTMLVDRLTHICKGTKADDLMIVEGADVSATSNITLRSSIAYSTTTDIRTTQDLIGTGVDQADYLDYNLVWDRALAGRYGNFSITGKSVGDAGFGGSDLRQDPQFNKFDATIQTWDSSLGGPGTVANAFAELLKMNGYDRSGNAATYNANYSRAGMIAYFTNAFRPQNTALKGTGYGGSDIGAVSFLLPSTVTPNRGPFRSSAFNRGPFRDNNFRR